MTVRPNDLEAVKAKLFAAITTSQPPGANGYVVDTEDGDWTIDTHVNADKFAATVHAKAIAPLEARIAQLEAELAAAREAQDDYSDAFVEKVRKAAEQPMKATSGEDLIAHMRRRLANAQPANPPADGDQQ